MKLSIILITFLFISAIAFAQDFEPTQVMFTVDSIPNYYISADSAVFKQNKFKFGFIWSGDYRMNSKLGFIFFLQNQHFY